MTDKEKEKLERAYRAWMDKNPDADKPTNLSFPDGARPTPRQLMEIELATGIRFREADRFLDENPDISLNELIVMCFGPQPPEEKSPEEKPSETKPQKPQPPANKRRYKM